MTITNQNKDKEQLNLETFQKCVSETETKFSYIDGQKENFVRTLADHCNKNGIFVEEARIAIKEKYNYNDELVTKIITKEYSNKNLLKIFLMRNMNLDIMRLCIKSNLEYLILDLTYLQTIMLLILYIEH